MDPITAISLASSLITFVDFASKVVTGTYEVYSSNTGATTENAHIDSIMADLRDVAADLHTDATGKSKQERALRDIASKCSKVANDLLLLLGKIKTKGSPSTLKSLKSVFATMRKQKEIAGLEKRLEDYRSQILLRLTVILQDQTCSIKLQLDKLENATLNMSSESALRTKALRQNILQDIKQLLDSKMILHVAATRSSDRLLDLKRDLLDLSSLATRLPRENIILQNLHFDSIDSRERAILNAEDGTFEWLFQEDVVKDENDVKDIEALNTLDPAHEHERLEHDVKQSTIMQSANGEELTKDSPVANSATANPGGPSTTTEEEQRPGSPDFEWREADTRYLENDQLKLRAETRARFKEWLNSGCGVFHISGKAGSGKSTFLKFICSHKRTEEQLKGWAGDKKLMFCAFYFWKSPDEMQMSIEGLYRSILFTTLRQCPELIPVVFPTHWEKLNNELSVVGRFISYSDLVSAFEILTNRGTFPSHRFCYFVDGLDEYHGHNLDHVRLVKSLKHWARGFDVKICASSRPYIEYENLSTSLGQMLQLHLLTRHDIHLFSRQMIEKDDNFGQIKDSYLELVSKIVKRSKGVFLWARLVVNSLLVGMLRHDNLETLKKKLSVVPGDINQLYNQLLNSLDDYDRQRAIELLLLTAHPPFDFTIITYWMFDNFNRLAFNPKDITRPTSWPTNEEMTRDAQLQIQGLAKGILEIRSESHSGIDIQVVDFFHRTARDFVLEQLESAMQKGSSPGDEVIYRIVDRHSLALLRLAELTCYDIRTRKVVWNHHFALWIFICTKNIALEVMDAYRTLLEDLDTNVSAGPWDDDHFLGYERGPIDNTNMHQLSFVHLAAYTGQVDYVLQEIDADSGLLSSGKDLNILASAIAGERMALAKVLMERGCSPNDSINCWLHAKPQDCPDGSIPIWLAILQYDIGSMLEPNPYRPSMFLDILLTWEALFAHPDINACNCFMLFALPGMDVATHFITLKNFIQDLGLEGTELTEIKERLLALLDKGRDNLLMGAAKQFVSRFIQFTGQSKYSVPVKPDGYIPYSWKEKDLMLKVVVCDSIQVSGCRYRVY